MKRLLLAVLATCTTMMAQPYFYGRCTTNMLRGTYVVSYTGYITTPAGSTYLTLFGVLSIDPSQEQNVSGAVTVTGLGATPIYFPTSGKATINPDCSGTVNLGEAGSPPTEVDQFVYEISSGMLYATTIRIQVAPIASVGTWKKISPMPHDVKWPAPPTT